MSKVKVNLTGEFNRSYEIVLGSGLFEKLAADLKKNPFGVRYVIITDSKVLEPYATRLKKLLSKQNIKSDIISFPAGERSKNRRVKERLEDRMLDFGHGRDSCIIAVGGGVVGDIAGFVAATYMRGIPFIQVPTTLLAMADSSIGGKTAIDVPAGKNMIGAFHQPVKVYADLETLKTLPKKQYKAGLAEVIKHGIIADARLFKLLNTRRNEILELEPKILEKALKLSMEVKAEVVSRDETESNLRMVLNFGHTIGHALERLSRYRLLHGNAVALGMVAEASIARHMGILPEADFEAVAELVRSYGYQEKPLGQWSPEKIMEAAQGDKKSRGGEVRFVLPKSIGEMAQEGASYGITVPVQTALKAISEVI